jgi:hypothetical protein
MNAETWIALAAVVIAVAAAVVSIHQAKTAKDSARAAQEQVVAAKEANQLTRQQMAQQAMQERHQAAEAEQASQREAERVRVELGGNGGSLTVRIANHSYRPISDVQLVDVAPEGEGPWRSWKPNPNVGPKLSTTSWPLLHPERDETVAVWLLDEDGGHVRKLPRSASVEIRFRDDDGQWWSVVTGTGAHRVAPPTP